MKQNKLRFAFAVNHNNNFEAAHFGDADKFLVYEFSDGEFCFIEEHENSFKRIDEEAAHGSKKKGSSIISLLKNGGVNVLVSQQFGLNIQMVNKYFIPVIIRNNSPQEVLTILSDKVQWLFDELDLGTKEYKLFTINKGIMKCSVKKGIESACKAK